MEMAYDAAFSARFPVVSLIWQVESRTTGWRMNPPEEGEVEKSNNQLAEEQPLEEKATERLSHAWAALPSVSW